MLGEALIDRLIEWRVRGLGPRVAIEIVIEIELGSRSVDREIEKLTSGGQWAISRLWSRPGSWLVRDQGGNIGGLRVEYLRVFDPRTSLLCRRQILPAPLAIFNKLCEILDWIYEIYVDLLLQNKSS